MTWSPAVFAGEAVEIRMWGGEETELVEDCVFRFATCCELWEVAPIEIVGPGGPAGSGPDFVPSFPLARRFRLPEKVSGIAGGTMSVEAEREGAGLRSMRGGLRLGFRDGDRAGFGRKPALIDIHGDRGRVQLPSEASRSRPLMPLVVYMCMPVLTRVS